MKVFIAWSGSSSKCVAQILHEWLPSVLPYVKPWMSEEDIAKGTRWNAELWKNLRKSDFGILCLVPMNVIEPWIIFEAGTLLGGRAHDRVSPFLLGLEPSEVPVPLRLLQCTHCDKRDVRRLLNRLNEVTKDKKLSQLLLERSFQKNWSRFQRKLKVIDLTQTEEETEDASESEEDGKLTTESVQLDDVHISILKFLATSGAWCTWLITLEVSLQKPKRLIIVKLLDLIHMDFVRQVDKQGFVIKEKGIRFLDGEGLL